MTEPSTCGGNASSYQITLATCYYTVSVLASERGQKESNAPFIGSPVVYEEKMRSGYCSRLVLCVPSVL